LSFVLQTGACSKLVHPKDLIKQLDLSTEERMKLKKLTQVVPSSPGRGATLQVGSQPRSSRHRLAAGAARRRSPPVASPHPPALGAAGSGPARRVAATDCSSSQHSAAPPSAATREGTRATLPLQPHAQIRPMRGSARALPLPLSCCCPASRRPPAAELPPAAARERVRERG